jgi:oligoendopeptidase F
MYKDQGKSFVPKYLALLEAGGSASPEELLRPLGVNIQQAEFWQQGFEEIKDLLVQLRKLI